MIAEKFSMHVPHLGKLYCDKALDKIIIIHLKICKTSTLSFPHRFSSNRIDGYSHVITKIKTRATLNIFFSHHFFSIRFI